MNYVLTAFGFFERKKNENCHDPEASFTKK